MNNVTLITGGVRSGKSRYAMKLAEGRDNRAFIATATALDEEMKTRIAIHRKERDGNFLTVEEPRDIASAIRNLPHNIDVALIDCLTVWLGNLMHANTDPAILPEIDSFLTVLDKPPCDLIIVTNEVGSGIVPDNPMARQFRDIAGTVNQRVADKAQNVVMVTCGIPVYLKNTESWDV